MWITLFLLYFYFRFPLFFFLLILTSWTNFRFFLFFHALLVRLFNISLSDSFYFLYNILIDFFICLYISGLFYFLSHCNRNY